MSFDGAISLDLKNVAKTLGLETPLQVASCINDPLQCGIDIAISSITRDNFYKIPQCLSFIGKTLGHISAEVIKRTSSRGNALIQKIQPFIEQADEKLQEGNIIAKKLLFPPDNEIQKNAVEQIVDGKKVIQGPASFNALHFIGAAYLSGKMTKKSLEHLADVALSIKRLMSRETEFATIYKAAKSPVYATLVQKRDDTNLISSIFWTAVWGFPAVLTNLGMIDALEKAGATNPVLAATLATAASTMYFLAPTIHGWLQRYRATQQYVAEANAEPEKSPATIDIQIEQPVDANASDEPKPEWDPKTGFRWKKEDDGVREKVLANLLNNSPVLQEVLLNPNDSAAPAA